jgi:hypothetical protein
MSNLASRNESVVTSLRSYLRGLARKRSNQTVTADDAQKYMNRNGMLEGKVRSRIAVINSTFQGGEFRPVGYTNSTRPEAKGRSITEWSLA